MNQRQKKQVQDLIEIYGEKKVLRGIETLELERHFKEAKKRIEQQLQKLEA